MSERDTIGGPLRALRERRGLRQADLCLGPGLDGACISRFEQDQEVTRFVKHVPTLLHLLGPEIWNIAYRALAQIHGQEWPCFVPVAKALVESLIELTEPGRDVTGPVERDCWRLRRLPTLQELAAKMGHRGKLTLQEQLSLAALIELVGLPVGEIKPDSDRRRRVRRLKAELERLAK